MSVKFDPKTGNFNFAFDENDINDAREIQATMATPGWKKLMQYWQMGQDQILVAGMDGIRTRAKRDLSDVKWAILKGFTECKGIPERVVNRADAILKAEKDKEKDNGSNADDE